MTDATERPRPRRRLLPRLAAAVAACAIFSAPAAAAEEAAQLGNIDYVEPGQGRFSVLFSIPGADNVQPDLGSVAVTLDGEPLEATAQPASDSGESVRRTAVLAMDVSNSMRADNRFEEAKAAAKAFLETVPDDIYVGIVTFAGDTEVALEPTQDREAAVAVVDKLSLSLQTLLYDGVGLALETAGAEGQRSLLVLSDGRDTSDTPLAQTVNQVSDSGVTADVVALPQSEEDEKLLEQISNAGGGTLIHADEPEALTELFASKAEALARQVSIEVTLPDGVNVTEGTLGVSLDTSEQTFTDEAFVTVAKPVSEKKTKTAPVALEPPPAPLISISPELMLGGLAAVTVGLLILLLSVFGVLKAPRRETVEDRIGAYSRKGGKRSADKRSAAAQPGQPGQPPNLTASAVGFAQKALSSNKGFEVRLGQKLEAAGMALKPAEWLLAHAGVAFLFSLVGLLLSSGKILVAVLALLFGAVLPWAFLSFKRTRRVKGFKGGLADTLQLMSGSLSAGLSLAQSVDTVVREGMDPIAGEFRRAIIETRLGVDLEEALEAVAERMESKDFKWVVMAIRIQREVGGNLAELLNTVAATIREREYLERQVLALSAEGRLSVWILGGLPPGFMAYLAVSNPAYLSPLISSVIGYIALGTMAVLLVVGIFWMKKLVKVEV